jgi:cytoskeleton protein RodZ
MASNDTDQPVPASTNEAEETAHDQAVLDTVPQIADEAETSLANSAEETAPALTPSSLTHTLPGELLAAKRNELRLTIEEVALRLKLAPRQIAALESNDFTSLPGMASVRGFIRSYAKLLELDADALLAMLSSEPNPAADPIVLRRPLPSRGFPGRRYAPPHRHRHGSSRLSGLAWLVLIFVGALAYSVYRYDLVNIRGFDIPSIGPWLSAWADRQTATPPSTADQPSSPSVNPIATETKAIDPSHLLELRLREDAWVEISALNGNKLVSRLMKAGTTEQFDIVEPVILVIGNASGVDASLRGQTLNLRAVARDNVSKLSLK